MGFVENAKNRINEIKQERHEESEHQREVKAIEKQRRRKEEIRMARKKIYEPKRGVINRTLDFTESLGKGASNINKSRQVTHLRSRQKMRNNQIVTIKGRKYMIVNQQEPQPQESQRSPSLNMDGGYRNLFAMKPMSFGSSYGRNYDNLFPRFGKKKR